MAERRRTQARKFEATSSAAAAANGGLSWARTRRYVPRSTGQKRIWLGGHGRGRPKAAAAAPVQVTARNPRIFKKT